MWGKILVATRLEKAISARFLQVWTDFVLHGLRDGDDVLTVRGLVAHRASNNAVRHLLKGEFDSIFFLDSDADITPDFLETFREYEAGWDYDILQAFYTRRGWPPRAIWIQENALGDTMETFITNPDTIEDVAIAGTHAVLIKRHVFEKMLDDSDPETFDWFFYPRHSSDSEDGAFSREARRAGFKVGATTHLKAGHITEITTGWETYIEFLNVSGRLPLIERYRQLSGLVAEFTGESQAMVVAKAIKGNVNVRDAWEKMKPQTAVAVCDFYGDYNNGYLYDLLNWNCQPLYERIITPLKEIRESKVLVIGAGLGTELEYLHSSNQVDVYELPGVLSDFLKFRFNGSVRLLDQLTGSDYDLIVALDVIEHIHPAEIDGFLDTLDRLLKPEGALYTHNNFGEFDKYPMHYDHSQKFEAWLIKRGLKNAVEMC